MQLLHSATRNYSWGSKTLIPELLGQPPAASPIAELWFGAHPAAPSTINGEGLDEIIARDPAGQLGERVSHSFGTRLPFLLKLLAAEEPLSLQAHPSKAQAEEGFARENAAGLALDAANRNYKDDNHKPELIVALTEFYAMAGFRPLTRTRELFAELKCPELDRYVAMLGDGAESEDLRALFTTWITIPAPARRELIAAVVGAGQRLVGRREDWMSQVMETVIELNERYPGDIGVLGALLLNHIVLQPGEGIYLDAGQLHAYVRGLGVEIMANSDNVLRGGLTPKFVDVPELVKVLSYAPAADPRAGQATAGLVSTYDVPIDEFALDRIDLDGAGEVALDYDGPAIVLATAGSPQVGGQALHAGQALWLAASESPAPLSGTGQVFVARV